MKKLKTNVCMLLLCMMVSTLTVYADDRSFDGGGGITFEGSADIEPTPTSSPQEPTPTSLPQETDKPSDKGTASGSKSSLPQTGQKADGVLPAAGCAILIFAGRLVVGKSRRTIFTAGV